MHVIYIFGDSEHGDLCKIGYDGNWPDTSEKAKKVIRYEQARSHNPREVQVHGIWLFDSGAKMKEAEKRIHAALYGYRRMESHGREWFNISCREAVKKILQSGAVHSEPLSVPPPIPMDRPLPYDDWRDPGDVYKGEVYKRLLWVFREDSPSGRFKVIHSPLYDTCYRYAFTYNPFPVYLVAAYHHSFAPAVPCLELREGNEVVQACWKEIVSDKTHGPGLMAVNVGWLNQGAILEWISRKAVTYGLVFYDLRQPKPACMRPRDPQITPINAGESWLKRVRQG